MIATSLDNIIVGGKWLNIVSIRFQAVSDILAAIRTYWVVNGSGYAAGNGGSYSYSLHSDDLGIPGDMLDVASIMINRFTENKNGNFPLVCFSPVRLTRGSFYHIVVQNTVLAPHDNYSSLDFLVNSNGIINQTPDVQILVQATGVPWKPADRGIFIGSPVALFYSDGTVQGYGYYQLAKDGSLMCGQAYGFPASICP